MEEHEKRPDRPADADDEATEAAERASNPPPWLGFETEVAWRGLRRRRAAERRPSVEDEDEDQDADATELPDGRA
jgi:hypothetical protein